MDDYHPQNSVVRRKETHSGMIDIIAFCAFFLAGIILMYVGYFNAYSENLFIIYISSVLVAGTLYVIHFGLVAAPQKAIYNWLAMFVFFPKKPLPTYMESLLNVGLGTTNVPLSLYQVLDIFVVLAILVAMGRSKRVRREENLLPSVQGVYFAFSLLAVVGILHVERSWAYPEVLGEAAYNRVLLGVWPLIAGLVVFRGSLRLIRTRRQVETLFGIAILASVALVAEFVAVKLRLLPEIASYYSFNYRGAFRSAVQSGDLFVTLLLILGTASSLYFYVTRGKKICLLFALAFSYLVVETYNRGSLVALVVAALFFLAKFSRGNRWKVVAVSSVLVLGVASYSMVQDRAWTEVVGGWLNVGNVHEGNYFESSSVGERIGAVFRSLDVFLQEPVLGAGPGNLVLLMSSPYTSSRVATGMLGPVGSDFYWKIMVGLHPTNPHNLAIHMLGEYGVSAILAVIMTVCALVAIYPRLRNRTEGGMDALYPARLCGYAVLLGYAVYYLFQSTPQVYGLLFLLLRVAIMVGHPQQQVPIWTQGGGRVGSASRPVTTA